MRIARLALVTLAMLLASFGPASGSAPAPRSADDTIVACESAPAQDADGVRIGTALILHRGVDPSDVSCDGTISLR